MNKLTTSIVFMLLCAPLIVGAQDEKPKDNDSYAIGVNIARSVTDTQIDFDVESILLGAEDVLKGRNLRLDPAQIDAANKSISTRISKNRENVSMVNLEAGKKFLAENAQKDGVKQLPSGMQYRIIKEGTGKKPKSTDNVVTHYAGRLLDGTEFDSSYKRGTPAEFPLNRVISGWTEALQLMSEGSKWELFIPPELAYGSNGSGPIGPNQTLIFEVELLEVR